MTEQEAPKEKRFEGVIRPLNEMDLPYLKPVLDPWIRFPVKTGPLLTEELKETLEEIRKSARGENDKKYLVAESDGKVVGIMGYQPLREEMASFTTTDKPIEVINAYVHFEHREGKGVGSALLGALEKRFKHEGYKEYLLNSGPRYRDTGWPFWTKQIGESTGELPNFYGPTFHAKVWQKTLALKS